MTRKILASAVFGLVLPVGSIALGGTVGIISQGIDPSHDLNATIPGAWSDVLNPSTGVYTFDFEDTLIGSTSFSLIGTLDESNADPSDWTVTGTFTAGGDEQFPSLAPVIYNDVITQVDVSSGGFYYDPNDSDPLYGANGQLYFLVAPTPTSAPTAVIWMNIDDNAADVSPLITVPTPAAISGGAALLGLLGLCSRRRLMA